jgi:hypothetical protein
MSFLGAMSFLGLDPATGMLSVPLWTAGAAAAFLVVFCLLAFRHARYDGPIGGLARAALVLVGAVAALLLVDGSSRRDPSIEGRALEGRAFDLLARATAPGSALACLDVATGETVEAGCEKAVFATPESTAMAVAYVSSQVVLLRDLSDYVGRARTREPAALVHLRRAIESDRFGLVAQVLAVREGCTPNQCRAFSLLSNASRVRANMAERTYDYFVVRYAGNWPTGKGAPIDAATTGSTPMAANRPPSGKIFLPSSDSIPPVNIMNAEPPLPSEKTEAAGKQSPNASRRPAPSAGQSRQQPMDLNAAARSAPPGATTQ